MPLQQQYGETKELIGTAAYRLAHPSQFLTGGTIVPPTAPPLTQNQNPNPIAPPTNQALATGTSPNTKILGGTSYNPPQPQIPTLQPPVGNPQTGQGGGGSQVKIELPNIFKMNSAIAGPTTIPPLSIRGGVTMPAVTPGVKPQTFPSMNWSDFRTVAHSR